MKEGVILFDIDRTVLDTETSGKKYKQKLAECCRVGKKDIEEQVQKYRLSLRSSTDFDPNELLKEIGERYQVSRDNLEQVLFNRDNFVLFAESDSVLKAVSERFILGTFSEGAEAWQKKKLELTGINEFFDTEYMIIKRRKMNPESIKEIPFGAMVVDDKKTVIGTLKQLRPDLKLVWINRDSSDRIDGVRNIKSLTELVE